MNTATLRRSSSFSHTTTVGTFSSPHQDPDWIRGHRQSSLERESQVQIHRRRFLASSQRPAHRDGPRGLHQQCLHHSSQAGVFPSCTRSTVEYQRRRHQRTCSQRCSALGRTRCWYPSTSLRSCQHYRCPRWHELSSRIRRIRYRSRCA